MTATRTEPATLPTPAPDARQRTLAAVAEIWTRSRPQILARVDALEAAALALLEGELDEELQRSAEREAHKLVGAAGTFGFAEASRLARHLEQAFGATSLLAPDAVVEISTWIVALRHELEQPQPRAEPVAPSLAQQLLLVCEDAVRAGPLAAEAARRRWIVHTVATPGAARAHIRAGGADVVVLDLPPTDAAGREHLALLSELGTRTPPGPVLALSAGTDALQLRLEIARRGGKGPLSAAASPVEIADGVARLLDRSEPVTATVLAVDDDAALLELAGAILEPHGFAVATLADPLRFWEVLESTAPDVLVLDVDMPGASGIELCRTVRNDPRWADTPVLFLTARRDPEIVHAIFEAGADDFINKPLVGPELVTRIRNRLDRTRLLRSQAETDSLTGIATRRKGERDLDRYFRLARRHGHPMCLAVLDLDHFKSVNDHHGHAAGDAVLRRVAQLLHRSFRTEDVVARWGGEEFVVGMYSAHREDGVRRFREVLAALRDETFAGAGGAPFSVSFSAGVAAFPGDAPDLQQLYETADRALYTAKAAGRDQVVSPGETPRAAASDRHVDVVLVEDDPALAALLLHALDSHGYRTRWLRDGTTAVEQLGGAHPALKGRAVLLDVDLPGLDGLSVLRRLARDGVLPDSRVIMLTARSTEPEVVQALEMDAFDHIAKPFSVPVLLQRLQRALQSGRSG